MSALLTRFWSPKRKAWVAALFAAAGTEISQLIEADGAHAVQLLRSAIVAVVTFIVTYQVPNTPAPPPTGLPIVLTAPLAPEVPLFPGGH